MKGDHQVILAVIIFFGGIAFANLVTVSSFNNFYPYFSTLVSAFSGAFFAFKLKSSEDKRIIREKNRVAGNLAVFNITRMLNNLLNYQKQFIQPVRGDEYAFLKLQPVQTIERINIDLDSLVFLLDSDDVNFLGELAASISASNSLIDSINNYSQDHMHKLQLALEQAKIIENDENLPSLFAIEQAIGSRLYTTMKGSAEQIIEKVDFQIPNLQGIISKLVGILQQQYPSERIITYKIRAN